LESINNEIDINFPKCSAVVLREKQLIRWLHSNVLNNNVGCGGSEDPSKDCYISLLKQFSTMGADGQKHSEPLYWDLKRKDLGEEIHAEVRGMPAGMPHDGTG